MFDFNTYSLRKKKRSWWISFFLFLTAFFVGVSAETSGVSLPDSIPAKQIAGRYEMMLLCFALLLLYLVPFAFFLRYTCRKMDIGRFLPLASFFTGWFVCGWMAGELNGGAESLITHLTSDSFANTWSDALEAPIVEESIKLLAVLWVLSLFSFHKKKDYLVSGMCVGMGFQISEDLSYIEDQIAGSYRDYVSAASFTINERIAGSLVSHWCYTAVMTIGLYLILHRKQKSGILLMLAVLVDHALWDSPLNDTGALAEALLCSFFFVLFIKVYLESMQEAIEEKEVDGIKMQ